VVTLSAGLRWCRAALALGLAAAALGAGAADTASAATCQSWGAQPPSAENKSTYLTGIAATSNCNGWAVGYYDAGRGANQTLIEHWDGAAWTAQATTNPGGSSQPNELNGVSAASSTHAWAVGRYYNASAGAYQTLIEDWTGSAWQPQMSPNAGSSNADNRLDGVAATSASNAWAVGSYKNGSASQTLIEHWDGTAWKIQKSLDPGGPSHDNALTAVAASSTNNAWAVGYYFDGSAYRTLIEHWNGESWKRVASRNPGGSSHTTELFGVAVISSGGAWAVGYYNTGTSNRTLVEHWNGSSWTVQPSPNPLGSADTTNILLGAAAGSSTSAWAVGYDSSGGAIQTVIEHWNGSAWKVQPSPDPGGSNTDNLLLGVAAASPAQAWAAGHYFNGQVERAAIARGSAPSSAPNCQSWGAHTPNAGPGSNFLQGVARTSGCDAWAVGYFRKNSSSPDHTLIEHWDGTTWKRVPSQNPGGASGENKLLGIAASSPADTWAVGYYSAGGPARTLVERWNGSAWQVQMSPSPSSSHDNILNGVASTSSKNAWAVGYYNDGSGKQTLIEHWNGKGWKKQKSQDPGGSNHDNVLTGIAAVSANNAWAVGYYSDGTTTHTLVEHWNGSAWVVRPSANAGSATDVNELYGVTATSQNNAWAVGFYDDGTQDQTLVEHWDGTSWTVQPSPNPPGGTLFPLQLSGVAATSPSNAWVVGYYHYEGTATAFHALIEHWDGTSWAIQPSPTAGDFDERLNGAAATSSTTAWAAGNYESTGLSPEQTLVAHCC
jgi:hypothetical protein